MATEEHRHITRQEHTWAVFYANGDHGQSCITTDNNDWTYFDDGGTELYKLARQSYYDGSTHYLNNSMAELTLYDDLLADEFIKLNGATDNNIRFEADKLTFTA